MDPHIFLLENLIVQIFEDVMDMDHITSICTTLVGFGNFLF